jgi:soluble P-type ATPase
LRIKIPGYGTLELKYLVMDYNGTLAVDGVVVKGVEQAFDMLAADLELHVITADTFGVAAENLNNMPCRLSVLPPGDQAAAKLDYIDRLGAESTVAIGNGRNDRLMLAKAALGICVILEEGAAVETITSADVICPSVLSALGLLLNPLRLTATLRS